MSAEPSGYQLLRPTRVAGRLRVVYRPLADILLEIHSHGAYPACFSRTDDADEQGFGLYGVIGRLGTERPEVGLRVGVYGYFLPVPWESVFEGDRGPFREWWTEVQTEQAPGLRALTGADGSPTLLTVSTVMV